MDHIDFVPYIGNDLIKTVIQILKLNNKPDLYKYFQLKKMDPVISSMATLGLYFNDNFVVNNSYKLFVRVEKFNDSSIDVLVYTFTSTNDWEKYLGIKEELALIIKEIVEVNQSSFAFPSQSIYIEKK